MTSSPDLITGIVSLLELVGGLGSSVAGDFLGRGDPDMSGEMLTTEPDLGDAAGSFLVSGSYGLNMKDLDVVVVGGDVEVDDADEALTTSETTIEGLFLFLFSLLLLLLLLPLPLDFSCNNLLPPMSAPICEHVWARS